MVDWSPSTRPRAVMGAARQRPMLWIAVALAAGWPVLLTAQRPRNHWELHVDNDLFAFWRSSPVHNDRDYTSGFELAMLRRRTAPTAAGAAGSAAPSLPPALTFSLAQQLFTPDITATRPVPSDRPFAALLTGQAGLRWERPRGYQELRAAVGVTGRPALGEPIQRLVHGLLGSPVPTGWRDQIPFRVAVNIGYAGAREMLTVGPVLRPPLRLAAHWGAEAGSIATRAHAGLRATVGVRPPAGWLSPSGAGRWRLYAVVGGQFDLVHHLLVLDEPIVEDGPRLDPSGVVWRAEVGVGFASGRIRVGWSGHLTAREFPGQPRPPAFGRFSVALQ